MCVDGCLCEVIFQLFYCEVSCFFSLQHWYFRLVSRTRNRSSMEMPLSYFFFQKILQTLTSWHCRYILGVWGTVFAIFLLILGILIKVKALSIIAICLVGLFTSFFQACIYGKDFSHTGR